MSSSSITSKKEVFTVPREQSVSYNRIFTAIIRFDAGPNNTLQLSVLMLSYLANVLPLFYPHIPKYCPSFRLPNIDHLRLARMRNPLGFPTHILIHRYQEHFHAPPLKIMSAFFIITHTKFISEYFGRAYSDFHQMDKLMK